MGGDTLYALAALTKGKELLSGRRPGSSAGLSTEWKEKSAGNRAKIL